MDLPATPERRMPQVFQNELTSQHIFLFFFFFFLSLSLSVSFFPVLFLVSPTVAQTERYDSSIAGRSDVDTSGLGEL